MKKIAILVISMVLGLVSVGTPVLADASAATDANGVPRRALVIKAPQTAGIGEKVVMGIYEQQTGKMVPKAGVWALLANADPVTTSNVNDLQAIFTRTGVFLGFTDDNGQLVYAFQKAGRYLLVAAKDGYAPGYAKILVKDSAKALAIRAPDAIKVLEPVPVQIVEKSVLTVEIPVAKVAVWAVSKTTVPVLDETTDVNAVTLKVGMFLGWTNEKGYVDPYPVFHSAGQYWLIAVKDGYTPGHAQITVKPPLTATAKPLPSTTAKPVSSTSATAVPQVQSVKPVALNSGLLAIIRKLAPATLAPEAVPAPGTAIATAGATK